VRGKASNSLKTRFSTPYYQESNWLTQVYLEMAIKMVYVSQHSVKPYISWNFRLVRIYKAEIYLSGIERHDVSWVVASMNTVILWCTATNMELMVCIESSEMKVHWS